MDTTVNWKHIRPSEATVLRYLQLIPTTELKNFENILRLTGWDLAYVSKIFRQLRVRGFVEVVGANSARKTLKLYDITAAGAKVLAEFRLKHPEWEKELQNGQDIQQTIEQVTGRSPEAV